MTELFDIFGDRVARQALYNVGRNPLLNNENVSTGPMKSNEPVKKAGDAKKTFLSNSGKAFLQTGQKSYTAPSRITDSMKKLSFIPQVYSDDTENAKLFETIEFTPKQSQLYDDYEMDIFHSQTAMIKINNQSPPSPKTKIHCMELDLSYQDDFFTDDFTNQSLPYEDNSTLDLIGFD